MRSKLLRAFLGGVACAVALGGAALAQTVDFNIPRGDLKVALGAYARVTGVQLIYRSDDVRGRQTGGVRGPLAAPAALDQLLAGTGLAVHRDPSGAVAIVPAASSAKSPEAEVEATALDELVVTANRREQRLLDVPMSVSAVSPAKIDHAGIRSFLDLARATPGLVVEESGPGQNRIFMRGVANGNSSTSLVGVYLDEMPVTGSAFGQLDLQLVDLERVEVLRGPQGTLYGQGSAGGTIRFITRQPDLEAYSGRADLEAYGTAHGAGSARLTGAVNIPVVKDVFGLRISGTLADLGGWVDQPAAGRKDINNQNLRDVRVKGLWTPVDGLKVEGFVIVHRNDGDGMAAGADANSNVAFPNGNPKAQERLVDNFDLYNGRASYDFGPTTLLSSTSYTRSKKQADGYSVKMPGFESFNQDSQNNKIFTQELRLNSSQEGALKWVVGAFYTDETFDRLLVLNQYSAGSSLGVVPLPTLDTSKAWSVFGDASYVLSDRLEVGAGVRYFHDRRGQRSGGLDLHNTFTSVDPRFYATFAVTPELKLYANVAKGFRSGGFAGDTTARTFGPENVWSYEAGIKGTMWARLRYELTGFYSDYRDIQTFALTSGILGGLVNSGTAHAKGVDWLLAFDPTPAFTLEASGNVTNAKLVSVLPTSFSNVVGDRADFVPDYTLSLSAEYRFDWADDFPGFVRLDFNQVGKSTYTDHSAAVVGYPSDSLQLLNARLGVRHEKLSAELFGQNLLDEHGVQDPLAGFGLGSRPRPRVIGVKLGAAF